MREKNHSKRLVTDLGFLVGGGPTQTGIEGENYSIREISFISLKWHRMKSTIQKYICVTIFILVGRLFQLSILLFEHMDTYSSDTRVYRFEAAIQEIKYHRARNKTLKEHGSTLPSRTIRESHDFVTSF
jgi:hypothetical protein